MAEIPYRKKAKDQKTDLQGSQKSNKRASSFRTSKAIGRTIEYRPSTEDIVTLGTLSNHEFWALFALRVYASKIPAAGPERIIYEPFYGVELRYIPFPFYPTDFAKEFYPGRKRIWKTHVEKSTHALLRLSNRKFGVPARNGDLIQVDLVNVILARHWVEFKDQDIGGIATEEDVIQVVENGAFIRVLNNLINSSKFFKRMENVLPALIEIDELRNDFTTRVQLLRLYEFITNWVKSTPKVTRDFEKIAFILNLKKYYNSRHKGQFLERLEMLLKYALEKLHWITDFNISEKEKIVSISLPDRIR